MYIIFQRILSNASKATSDRVQTSKEEKEAHHIKQHHISVSKKSTNVDIKVGIAQQVDREVKAHQGKTRIITVSSSANKEEITQKAKEKHASFDQSFDQAI